MLTMILKQLGDAVLRLLDQAEDALEVWDDPLLTDDRRAAALEGDRLLAA